MGEDAAGNGRDQLRRRCAIGGCRGQRRALDVWLLADIDNETIQDPYYPEKALHHGALTAAQSFMLRRRRGMAVCRGWNWMK